MHNVLDENDLSSSMGDNHKGTDPIPLVITAEEVFGKRENSQPHPRKAFLGTLDRHPSGTSRTN